MKASHFRHKTQLRVRNYEVDWQGVVHNANYLLYFEVGRVEYLKELGVKLDLNSIKDGNRVVLVRNEIDYKSSSYFDDLLDIYTRIAKIKTSSFTFEGVIEESGSKRLVCENIAVHVWLNQAGEPKKVSDDFRGIVRKFEGENTIIENAA